MPFIGLLKERESLSSKGEQFKEAVTRYLTSRGYELDIDSSIEGTFEDQVYFKKSRIRVNVECKDTKVGVYSEDFLIPFGIYLSKFMKLPAEERFIFIYCAREVTSRNRFKMIFDELDEASIHELLARTISTLQTSDRGTLNRIAETISTIDSDTLISFVSTSEVIEASVDDLERAAQMRMSSGTSPFIKSLVPIQRITESMAEQAMPEQIQEMISTNIFPVTRLPDTVNVASTNFPNAKSLIDSLDSAHYPFILRQNNLATFSNLSDEKNNLGSAIEGKPSQRRISDFLDTHEKRMWLLDLLNQSLRKHALSLQMMCWKGKYFFPSLDGRDVLVKWHTGTRLSNPRNLTKWYFAKKTDHPSFCKHRSLSMRFREIGGNYFLVLNPAFHFTKDGVESLNPRLTTKLSSGAWAKTRNDRVLYDVRFWANFLAQRKEVISIETGGDVIEVDTMPEIVKLEVGIHDDALPSSSFLEPIQTPIFRIYQAIPTRQVNLEDELLLESSSIEEEVDE